MLSIIKKVGCNGDAIAGSKTKNKLLKQGVMLQGGDIREAVYDFEQ